MFRKTSNLCNRWHNLLSILVLGVHAGTTAAEPIATQGNWYIAGSFGTLFESNGDTRIPSIFSKPPLTSSPVYDNGQQATLAIGLGVGDNIRVEAEYAYRDLPMTRIKNAIGAGTVTQVNNSSTELESLFINVLYDFQPLDKWHPYAGIGGGYLQVENTIRPNPKIPVGPDQFFTRKTLDYDTPGLQGTIGISYQLTNRLQLGMDYRALMTRAQKTTGDTNLGEDFYKTRQEITTQSLNLAIRYQLPGW
ncbi:MAG: outer membrane protein [bacterium]